MGGFSLFVLVLGPVLAAIAVAIFLVSKLRGKVREANQAALDRLGEHNIIEYIEGANFFGQKSRGMGQVRGNGCLGISRDAIVFEMWLPRRSFEILVRNITAVHEERSFLGKAVGMAKVIVIDYKSETGTEDAMGFVLPDWREKLKAIQKLVETR